MSRLNKLIAFFILVVFAATAFLFVRINNQRKQTLETSLISKQRMEELERERQEKQAEKREIEDIKKGLDKLIGGTIEAVDKEQGSFVLSVEEDEDKKYTIYTDENTSVHVAYVDLFIWGDQTEGIEGEEGREKIFTSDFASLKIGVNAQVEFAARMNLDEQQSLTAKKITIAYYKEMEEP